MKLLTTYKGKRRVPDGGVPADLDLIKALAAEARARTEMFTGVKVVSDETQMWAPDWLKAEATAEFVLPQREFCQVFERVHTPAACTEAVHLTALRTERTPIGDSIADDHGRFTLTCGHCRTDYADPGALTFAQLHGSAEAKGWRRNLFGYWACARDVRTNPHFLPLMPPAERTRAA